MCRLVDPEIKKALDDLWSGRKTFDEIYEDMEDLSLTNVFLKALPYRDFMNNYQIIHQLLGESNTIDLEITHYGDVIFNLSTKELYERMNILIDHFGIENLSTMMHEREDFLNALTENELITNIEFFIKRNGIAIIYDQFVDTSSFFKSISPKTLLDNIEVLIEHLGFEEIQEKIMWKTSIPYNEFLNSLPMNLILSIINKEERFNDWYPTLRKCRHFQRKYYSVPEYQHKEFLQTIDIATISGIPNPANYCLLMEDLNSLGLHDKVSTLIKTIGDYCPFNIVKIFKHMSKGSSRSKIWKAIPLVARRFMKRHKMKPEF